MQWLIERKMEAIPGIGAETAPIGQLQIMTKGIQNQQMVNSAMSVKQKSLLEPARNKVAD